MSSDHHTFHILHVYLLYSHYTTILLSLLLYFIFYLPYSPCHILPSGPFPSTIRLHALSPCPSSYRFPIFPRLYVYRLYYTTLSGYLVHIPYIFRYLPDVPRINLLSNLLSIRCPSIYHILILYLHFEGTKNIHVH